MNKYEETLKVAEFAEHELESLLSDVQLQSEKLINVQKKANMVREGMYKSNYIMDKINRLNKSRIILGVVFFVIFGSITGYFFTIK
ncbi:uncharacterized protein VNE69_02288 [Vairimorpha necatrix]|uniref:Membrane protein n=1 Tax=Vairimorpha necatrix TaxID=6039 RepID=A0AAX4J9V2_9MICR